MGERRFSVFAGIICALLGVGGSVAAAPKAAPGENLALKAVATANSEYSDQYLARFVNDAQIPGPGSQFADLGKAWCVKGDTHRNGAELALTWPGEITVAEIVYYGRTSWFAEECWKGCEVYIDQSAAPAAKAELQMGDGPQRITLPSPAKARKITIKFTSSYGGFNPGAAEIQVFAARLPEGSPRKFIKLPPGPPGVQPAAQPATQVQESPDLAAMIAEGRCGFTKLLVIQRKEINPTHVYTQHVEGFSPGGGLYVYAVGKDPGEGELRRLVAAGDGQMLDCDLSFDGREILFSWKKNAQDSYHLYTVNADGTDLKQLTEGKWHDYNACFLSDGGITFLSTRSARFAYCWFSPVGVLYRMDRDGSNVRRLSSSIINDFTPSLRNDGRIIYSRWEYVDKPAIPIQSLWTINPDGTGLSVFYGNRVLSPATFMEARSIPGTNKVLCTLTSHNGPARGAIGIIDPVFGVNAQEAITNLTPEIPIGQVDKGNGNNVRGPYENPYPLDQERFLVSKKGTIVLRDYAGRQQAAVIGPRDGMGFYSPMPLAPRPMPPVIPSHLPEKTGEDGWATIILQDVYNGLEPQVQRGEVKQICVVQEMKKSIRIPVEYRAFDFQFPVISCGATYASKTVWGYVPVEEDGSACFEVPAGVPLYFMAIDAQGRAVQRMRSFTHFMPGEVQGCIGCHEPRNHASPPRRPQAARAQARKLQTPEWGGPVGFDYSAIVQPVLDKYCARCHSGPTPPKKVDLTGDKTDYFNVSYESLARGRKGNDFVNWDSPYVSWIPSYNGMEANILQVAPKTWGSPRSTLADMILAGHPDEKGQPRYRMDEAGRRRVFAWIDLNVPYYGTSESAYPYTQGCRRILPGDLDKVLADVARRRCAECHKGGKVPRQFWTRITNPQFNNFLTAPLAKSAGGSEACGKAVFANTNDPDYQAILKTFQPVTTMLKQRPRDDMPGARPAEDVNRSCQ